MIGFIDDHRDRFGVEPICRVLSEHNLQVAPSGYYAFKSRKPSKRSLSDAAVWDVNGQVAVPVGGHLKVPTVRVVVSWFWVWCLLWFGLVACGSCRRW